MGRHDNPFIKNCLCFRCPLEDCRSPCPFGVDKVGNSENIDEYLFDKYIEIKSKEKDKKIKKKRAYNREYYRKNKEKLKNCSRIRYIKNKEQIEKDMFGNKEGE